MQVQLTSPAKGKMPGDKVTMSDAEGRWYVSQGYASVEGDEDHRQDSSVEAGADPTLAANREDPFAVGVLANDEDADSSEEVVSRQEFKGKAARGKGKIVPGRPETQVAALEATLEGADEDDDEEEEPTREEQESA